MKIQQKKRLGKVWKIVTIVILVVILAGTYLFVSYSKILWPFKGCPDETQTMTPRKLLWGKCPEQKNSSSDKATDDNNSPDQEKSGIESNSTDPDNKAPLEYSGENPNNFDELSGIVSYKSVSGDKLLIRTTIDQILSSGTCTLNLIGPVKYDNTVKIIMDPNTSTCAGWDIPLASLPSGRYIIEIDLISSDKTGKINDEVKI